MYFPKFWSKGSCDNFSAWHWSDISDADAKSKAIESAKRIATRVKANRSELEKRKYDYGERPLREEILEQITGDDGSKVAVLTRNAYGSVVLNSAHVMFLDIDLEPANGGGLGALISGIFGGSSKSKPSSGEQNTLDAMTQWCKLNSSWGLRAYKTAAGMRVIVTHAIFEPEHAGSEKIFDTLKVDPIYRKLCVNQKSFRARLTPKPWRCGISLPPVTWPYESIEQERAFQKWQKTYADQCEGVATCKMLGNFGSSMIIDEASKIIEIHDRYTKANSGLDLA